MSAHAKKNQDILTKQLGALFKMLRERSGATVREVSGRIDLGHGNDNTGIGVMKRVALISDFEAGKAYMLTAAHWVNIAEFFNIPFTNLIEEKGWPLPSIECATFVIKQLQEKYPKPE
jgi:transcriptional regulator with XRE-family HTH domain